MTKKNKTIDIQFEKLEGPSGLIISPQPIYNATISISFEIDRKTVDKYIRKKLTLKDLIDILK